MNYTEQAVINNNPMQLKLLIDLGFDLLSKTSTGGCLDYIAVKNDAAECLEVFIENELEFNPLDPPLICIAVQHRSVKVLELLIKKGFNVNEYGSYKSPLHIIFEKRSLDKEDLEMLKLLIDAGADINAKDENGRTPLFGAIESNSRAMIELLVSLGAEVNAKDKNGKTLLATAIENSDDEIIATVLKNGGVYSQLTEELRQRVEQ